MLKNLVLVLVLTYAYGLIEANGWLYSQEHSYISGEAPENLEQVDKPKKTGSKLKPNGNATVRF